MTSLQSRASWNQYTLAASRFQALSFEWGSPNSAQTIWVNDVPQDITPNLFSALRQIRSRWRNDEHQLVLWIDALCINQDDIKEKAHQIPLMQTIYPRAERVISWLGEPVDAEKADLVHGLNTFMAKLRPLTDRSFDNDRSYWHIRAESFEEIELSVQEAWTAMQYFLYGMSYWWRLWVLQECTLPATPPILLFGEHQLHSDNIRLSTAIFHYKDQEKAIGTFFLPQDDLAEAIFLLDPAFVRSSTHAALTGTGRPNSLSSLMSLTRYHQCKEPRDRIYALRGLFASEAYCSISGYIEPAHAVFWKALSVAFVRDQHFSWSIYTVFSLVPRDSLYPSWTVDFDHQISSTSAFIGTGPVSSQMEGEEPRFEISADSRQLSIHGYQVDVVKSVLHIPLVMPPSERHRSLVNFAWDCRFKGATACLAQQLYNKITEPEESRMRYLVYSNLPETLKHVQKHASSWTPEERRIVHEMATGLAPEAFASLHELKWVQRMMMINLEELNYDLLVFQTEGGFFGVTQSGCEIGDVVTILPGIYRSMLLRQFSSTRDDGREASYDIIGCADIEGNVRLKFWPLVRELGKLDEIQRRFHIC